MNEESSMLHQIGLFLKTSAHEEIHDWIEGNYELSLFGLRNHLFSMNYSKTNVILSNRLKECEMEKDDVLAYFMLRCCYQNDIPIFNSLNELATKISENEGIDNNLLLLHQHGCIEYYYRKYSTYHLSKEQLDRLQRIHLIAKKNAELGYFLLGYHFGRKKSYTFHHREYLNIKSLANDLKNDDYKIADFSFQIETNLRFQAWLIYLGYEETWKSWKETVEVF